MRQKLKGFTLVELLIIIAIIGTVVGLLLPKVQTPRHSNPSLTCRHHLQLISRALLSYEAKYGELPPAITTDAEGNPLHSWRALLLPFLDHQKLYDLIDFTKPWDDPANLRARETSCDVFVCPSASLEAGSTTYLALVGENCALSKRKARTLSEFVDGPLNTIVVIDAPSAQAVHLMSPSDATADQFVNWVKEGECHHFGILQAVFLGGSTAAFDPSDDSTEIKGFLMIAGGEKRE